MISEFISKGLNARQIFNALGASFDQVPFSGPESVGEYRAEYGGVCIFSGSWRDAEDWLIEVSNAQLEAFSDE